jgi:hypothetical protein
VGDNSTKIATTAFITTALSTYTSGRVALTANTTYFVLTTGSDSNTGLVNTAGGAFLTIGKALAVASAIDCGPWQLTIQVGAGTFTTPLSLPNTLGALTPILTGIGSTTIISTSTASTPSIVNDGSTPWIVNSMKIVNSGGPSGYLLATKNGGAIKTQSVEFGAAGDAHVFVAGFSSLTFSGNYTISGSSGTAHVVVNGTVTYGPGITVTLTGTPSFAAAFVIASNLGLIFANALTTFSGAATGPRYLAVNNGVIFTAGGGASYFPGSSVGSVSVGGVYA